MNVRPALALGADALTAGRALLAPVLALLVAAGRLGGAPYAARPAGNRVMPPAKLYAS